MNADLFSSSGSINATSVNFEAPRHQCPANDRSSTLRAAPKQPHRPFYPYLEHTGKAHTTRIGCGMPRNSTLSLTLPALAGSSRDDLQSPHSPRSPRTPEIAQSAAAEPYLSESPNITSLPSLPRSPKLPKHEREMSRSLFGNHKAPKSPTRIHISQPQTIRQVSEGDNLSTTLGPSPGQIYQGKHSTGSKLDLSSRSSGEAETATIGKPGRCGSRYHKVLTLHIRPCPARANLVEEIQRHCPPSCRTSRVKKSSSAPLPSSAVTDTIYPCGRKYKAWLQTHTQEASRSRQSCRKLQCRYTGHEDCAFGKGPWLQRDDEFHQPQSIRRSTACCRF